MLKNTLIYNVPLALFGVICATFFIRPVQPNYITNMFYHVDILMNALTGGNGNITISARVGYYKDDARLHGRKSVKFWRFAERIIDYTFYPMDGPYHCEQAYIWSKEYVIQNKDLDVQYMHGPTWSLVLLMFIIIFACVLLIPLLRIGRIFRLY